MLRPQSMPSSSRSPSISPSDTDNEAISMDQVDDNEAESLSPPPVKPVSTPYLAGMKTKLQRRAITDRFDDAMAWRFTSRYNYVEELIHKPRMKTTPPASRMASTTATPFNKSGKKRGPYKKRAEKKTTKGKRTGRETDGKVAKQSTTTNKKRKKVETKIKAKKESSKPKVAPTPLLSRTAQNEKDHSKSLQQQSQKKRKKSKHKLESNDQAKRPRVDFTEDGFDYQPVPMKNLVGVWLDPATPKAIELYKADDSKEFVMNKPTRKAVKRSERKRRFAMKLIRRARRVLSHGRRWYMSLLKFPTRLTPVFLAQTIKSHPEFWMSCESIEDFKLSRSAWVRIGADLEKTPVACFNLWMKTLYWYFGVTNWLPNTSEEDLEALRQAMFFISDTLDQGLIEPLEFLHAIEFVPEVHDNLLEDRLQPHMLNILCLATDLDERGVLQHWNILLCYLKKRRELPRAWWPWKSETDAFIQDLLHKSPYFVKYFSWEKQVGMLEMISSKRLWWLNRMDEMPWRGKFEDLSPAEKIAVMKITHYFAIEPCEVPYVEQDLHSERIRWMLGAFEWIVRYVMVPDGVVTLGDEKPKEEYARLLEPMRENIEHILTPWESWQMHEKLRAQERAQLRRSSEVALPPLKTPTSSTRKKDKKTRTRSTPKAVLHPSDTQAMSSPPKTPSSSTKKKDRKTRMRPTPLTVESEKKKKREEGIELEAETPHRELRRSRAPIAMKKGEKDDEEEMDCSPSKSPSAPACESKRRRSTRLNTSSPQKFDANDAAGLPKVREVQVVLKLMSAEEVEKVLKELNEKRLAQKAHDLRPKNHSIHYVE